LTESHAILPPSRGDVRCPFVSPRRAGLRCWQPGRLPCSEVPSGARGALSAAGNWYPLFAFVRREGYGPEDFRDLTQAYFAQLLEKDHLEAYERKFLIDAWRRTLNRPRRSARELATHSAPCASRGKRPSLRAAECEGGGGEAELTIRPEVRFDREVSRPW
jgi:hypothetical protein